MKTIIEVREISKKYKTGVYALRNISLTVETGDIYGIIGLSGAGKSTLIRCLSRLIIPTSGKVLFLGKDIASMDRNALRSFRKNIGMIFQHFNLLSSRTVAGNVAYPLEVAKAYDQKKVDELLRLVGLSHKKDAFPAQLSGGEKQRVGIARALANHPQVLLCDEATSSLDPKTTQEILTLLRSINKQLGVTIVLITHEMGVIKQICNKVAVIEEGQIVEEGLVYDVFSDPQHATTKHFLYSAVHEIPPELIKEPSPNRLLLRLKFKGVATEQPIISEIVRLYNVDANILLGWIDRLQTMTIGTLIIELTGTPEGISGALKHLEKRTVHAEVITNEL